MQVDFEGLYDSLSRRIIRDLCTFDLHADEFGWPLSSHDLSSGVGDNGNASWQRSISMHCIVVEASKIEVSST